MIASILSYGGVIMKDNLPRYTMRIEPELLQKLHSLAKYNGRSVNKELEQLVKKAIQEFEKTSGVLPIE